MEKVSYIIPIHKFNEDIKKYTVKAVESLNNLDNNEAAIYFTGPKDVLTAIEKTLSDELKTKQDINYLYTDEQDLYKKINNAAMQCVTRYFSVLEFDDTFYPYWNKTAQKCLNREKVSVLLPIVELFNEEGKVVGLMNEIAWDAAFTDNLGYLAEEELKTFKDFNVTGAFIKTDDFIAVGGLKPSMKIATWYEFLLRMVNNGKKIFVAPKIGYKHTVLRPDSYMVNSAKEITQEEGVWLINYALDDYKNKQDTQKTFQKQ